MFAIVVMALYPGPTGAWRQLKVKKKLKNVIVDKNIVKPATNSLISIP